MSTDYDIVIVGGGPVGASLACALEGQGLRMALVEAQSLAAQLTTELSPPSYDSRGIALAHGVAPIFKALGLWPALQPALMPITRIHISDRGHFGTACLDSREEEVEALGYVVEGQALGEVLVQRLHTLKDIQLLAPARVTDVSLQADAASLDIETDDGRRHITTRLLVAADGSQSPLRERLGIASRHSDYGQHAVIANVTPLRPHRGVAYERFTDSGPMALLPRSGGRCSLVWTVASDRVDEILALDDAAFLARLQQRFGYRLGRFQKVGARACYPLVNSQALEQVRPRFVLIGNAAHTLHPVAGQGFNLGLRDVTVLADVLMAAITRGHDLGDEQAVLRRYAEWRQRDQREIIGFTDGLVHLFSNPFAPVALARDAGLMALDLCPPLKHAFARHAMGLAGHLPRLARGLPLR